MRNKVKIASVIALLLIGCKPKIDAPEMAMGEVDASRMVSIGGSATAGYSDDALHPFAQKNSFVNIIAQQMSLVQTTLFYQPLLSEGSVGINMDNNSKLELGYKTDCNNETSLSPVRTATSGDATAFGTIVSSPSGYFNNLGTPDVSFTGLETIGYGNPANGPGNYNPYFARFASQQTTSSILSDAVNQSPTFFTMLLGDEDILAYAKSGGTATLAPANGSAGIGFDGSLQSVVSALTATGAKGVLGTIPDVLNYPYFTTIPYNGLTLDATNAVTLNSVYNPLGIYFVEGDNPFTVSDPAEPFGVRKLLPGELILLNVPLDSIKCYGMGSIHPIPGKYVLSLDEIAIIDAAISDYNAIITNIANTNNLALADVHGLYNAVYNGITTSGIALNADFVSGGFFSLDGRNLTARGQAFVANEFIKAINTTYNSKIPLADITNFEGVVFP